MRAWAVARFGLALAVPAALAGGAPAQTGTEHPAAAQGDGARSEVWSRSPGRDLAFARMWRFVLPLNNPPVVGAEEASHMRDADLVLGVHVGGLARAYPWWILTKYHVANDMIGKHPVYAAICEVCSGGAAFSPIVDGHFLSFQLCGLERGSFEVCDWETETRWLPFSGRAYEGPLAGERLRQLDFVYMTWADWKQAYPDSTVVLGSEELRARPHGLQSPPGSAGIARALLNTVHIEDPRLEPNALVFGLVPDEDGDGKAYPLEWLRERGGIVQDVVDGRPVLVILRGELGANAYVRQVGGSELEFARVSVDPLELRDEATGTLWTARGLELATGEFAAIKLPVARGYVTEWYEWLQSHPLSEVAE